MKTLTLTNWERFWLGVVIGSGQGTIAQIRLGNKVLDVLEMSDEEKAEVGWRVLPPSQIGWQREKDWELKFVNEGWSLVQMYVKNFKQWPQDRRAEVLYDKIMEERDE